MRLNPLEPRDGYFPTMIVGICSRCKAQCQLDIPIDNESLRTGDAVMDGKAVRGHCDNCSADDDDLVWFVPGPRGDANTPAQKRVQRTQAGLIALSKEIGVSEMRKLGLIP